MEVYDMRFSLSRGPRLVRGEMERPELGEMSPFRCEPGGAQIRGRLLKPDDWAIDLAAVRRKMTERTDALLDACVSNPSLCPPSED